MTERAEERRELKGEEFSVASHATKLAALQAWLCLPILVRQGSLFRGRNLRNDHGSSFNYLRSWHLIEHNMRQRKSELEV